MFHALFLVSFLWTVPGLQDPQPARQPTQQPTQAPDKKSDKKQDQGQDQDRPDQDRSQDPQPVALYTTGGDILYATVKKLDREAGRVHLRVHVLGGHMEVRRKIDTFDRPSRFLIEKLVAGETDYETNFALARRAGELRLFDLAGIHARQAIEGMEKEEEIEPESKKLKEVRSWAADLMEESIQEAVQQDDPISARHRLKLLTTRLSDMRSEEELGKLAELVDTSFAARAKARSDERQARLDEVQRRQIEQRLKPIQERTETGDRLLREAYASASTPSQSARLAERAIETYRGAMTGMQELWKKHDSDDALADEIYDLSQHAHDSAIRAALHVANVLTVRSDYKGGMEWAQKVLAYEPGNAEAKRMVRTIQIAAAAASAQWGWGWGTGIPTVGGNDFMEEVDMDDFEPPIQRKAPEKKGSEETRAPKDPKNLPRAGGR